MIVTQESTGKIGRPRVYDGFCFFNELNLLRLRLETLWDEVDVFVLVESTYTHAGKSKPLFYPKCDLGELASKIRHVVVDPRIEDLSDFWVNENRQRNGIARGLEDANQNDWLLVSDVDEIPRPESIRNYNPEIFRRGAFEMVSFAYFLNNCSVQQSGRPVPWIGTKITTIKHLWGYFGSVHGVRIFKPKGPWRAVARKWLDLFSTQKISHGGWHFSWMSGVEAVIKKLESFAHQEFNNDKFKNPESIVKRIQLGGDVLDLGAKFRVIPVDESFPAPLLRDPDRYKRMLATVPDP